MCPHFLMKVIIWLARISVQMKTLQVDLNQTKPYFEVTIPNSYAWWNMLSNGIQFVYVWCRLRKKSHFSRKIVKNASLNCLILREGSIETRNRNSRPLEDSFFSLEESNGGLRICKGASVENRIFWDKYYYIDLREISITGYLMLYFGNQAYHWTLVDESSFILSLNHYFGWQVKIWHFRWFCP